MISFETGNQIQFFAALRNQFASAIFCRASEQKKGKAHSASEDVSRAQFPSPDVNSRGA